MSHISKAILIGRDILAAEREIVAGTTDARREELGATIAQLMRDQQAEMIAAVNAGADWDTVRGALRLHGQDANREIGSTEPTPAYVIGSAVEKLGPDQFMALLGALRATFDN